MWREAVMVVPFSECGEEESREAGEGEELFRAVGFREKEYCEENVA